MVLVYLPTKLGDFIRANVRVHIPAPWFAYLSGAKRREWMGMGVAGIIIDIYIYVCFFFGLPNNKPSPNNLHFNGWFFHRTQSDDAAWLLCIAWCTNCTTDHEGIFSVTSHPRFPWKSKVEACI